MANILLRQLSVYNLPTALLASLQVRSIAASSSAATAIATAAAQDAKDPADSLESSALAPGGGLRCQACPSASFSSVEEQREHFKSDWHRYNVKARLTGRAVTAEEWDGLVEGVSSISGSASSSSSGSSDEDGAKDKVSRLLKRTTLAPVGEDSDEEAEVQDRQRRAHLRTAVIWFSPSTALPALGVPHDTQLGVHRALFPTLDNAADYLGELRRMQLGERDQEDDNEEERRITLLMVAGGHFAGMVVALNPRGKTDKQLVKGAGEVKVLKHKTFHRYTTRKKQGGSQGLNDNARGRVANSAGAMLRRYGEQALQEDIRGILAEWAEDIEASERIFIRASTHGKRSFWGYDGAVLHKDDERLRVFPFPTRRPTLQELLRCWNELAYVKVSHLSSEALAAQDEAYMASIQPKKQAVAKPAPAPLPAPAVLVPSKTPEELAREDRARRVGEMIKKGRVDALRTFWAKHAQEYPGPGLLAQAAMAGQEEVIRFFLEEVRVDPTMPLDPRGVGGDAEAEAGVEAQGDGSEADGFKGTGGKRAYDVCAGKGARNVFRRVAYAHPEWYDWSAAHVPSGLSDEMEDKQDAKKAERRKGLRDKMRERERERARVEAEGEGDGKGEGDVIGERVETPPIDAFRTQGPTKLGGRDTGGLAGMSADMRARVERERRARAAEERFRNLGVPGPK